MLTKYAHIINPFKASPDRDVYLAQPIVFDSIKKARDFAKKNISVELLTTQFREDREIIPEHFKILDDLDRSFLEDGEQEYKLPYIVDILDKAYESILDADYLIHSETDIGLMPFFYDTIDALVKQGYDAIIVNCRCIANKFENEDDLPIIWSEVGEKHPGWDCFIFRRDIYKKYNLGEVIVGANSIGRALFVNLKYHAKKFIELTDSHLTFHLGSSQHLVNLYNPDKDYFGYECNLHNEKEVIRIIEDLLKVNNEETKVWLKDWMSDCQNRLERYLNSTTGNEKKNFQGYWRLNALKKYWNSSEK